MNLKNKLLYSATKKTLSVNKKLKGLHSGENCYLFGNARSLKYYDLSKFNDKVSIGCNFLFLHKDFEDIRVKYYFNGDPLFLYPYRRNIYTKKIEKNILGKIFAEKVKEYDDTNFFINISDYPNLRGDNIFYLHHFGEKFDDYCNCSLDGVFPASQSALSGMLGIAIYLGFTDVTLVGFDHLLAPKASQHFYEPGGLDQVTTSSVIGEEVLNSAQKFLKVRVVSPNDNYKGHIIPHILYEDLVGYKTKFRENNEIIRYKDLVRLKQSNYYEIL
jgi:hypothetical protein